MSAFQGSLCPRVRKPSKFEDAQSIDVFASQYNYDLSNVKDRLGRTPLHVASLEGAPFSSMGVLCILGCEVDALDNNGHTALFNSIMRGDFQTVDFLIDSMESKAIDWLYDRKPILEKAADGHRIYVLRYLNYRLTYNIQVQRASSLLRLNAGVEA